MRGVLRGGPRLGGGRLKGGSRSGRRGESGGSRLLRGLAHSIMGQCFKAKGLPLGERILKEGGDMEAIQENKGPPST